MKPGISLLEVVVGLAIASILSLLLYRSLAQSNRTVRVIDAIVETQTQLVFFGDRITKDISGAFAPLESLILEKSSEQTPAAQPSSEGNKAPGSGKVADAKKKESPAKKRMTDIFLVENFKVSTRASSDKTLFTFITSNPLIVYGETTPRIVRVAYQLERGNNDLWQLKRLESPELDFKKFRNAQAKKAAPAYTILTNIQSLSVTCLAVKQEEEKPKDAQQAKQPDQKKEAEAKKPKPPPEYERFTSWSDQGRVKEKKKTIVPDFVEIKGVVLDNRRKREVPFTYMIAIAASAHLKENGQEKNAAPSLTTGDTMAAMALANKSNGNRMTPPLQPKR